MSVLLVTSFTPELFAASGERLVRSFIDKAGGGTMLVCHEGFHDTTAFRHRRIRTYNLGRSALLRDWLAANRDIIPIRFGGSAAECACPDPANPFAEHRRRCHNAWFNYHASRWFRKVVSLEYATRPGSSEYVVWIDCDCSVTAPIAETQIKRWFREKPVFYLKSPQREVIESGVLGVRNNRLGRKFVTATVERYTSGTFRKDRRWDDGYQFQLALRKHPEIPRIDLADGSIGGRFGHVVPCSPIGRYIRHHKGVNAVSLGWI
jgi:hypothetical protein